MTGVQTCALPISREYEQFKIAEKARTAPFNWNVKKRMKELGQKFPEDKPAGEKPAGEGHGGGEGEGKKAEH